jgi:hypothetical protein
MKLANVQASLLHRKWVLLRQSGATKLHKESKTRVCTRLDW